VKRIGCQPWPEAHCAKNNVLAIARNGAHCNALTGWRPTLMTHLLLRNLAAGGNVVLSSGQTTKVASWARNAAML
jgi:hypothetical protein